MSALNRRRFAYLLAGVPMAAIFSGCNLMSNDFGPERLLTSEGSARAGAAHAASVAGAPGPGGVQQASAQSTPQCYVEFRDGGKQGRRMVVPLDKPMHVQDILAQSGAIRQFGRMNLHMIRTTPTGNRLRMEITYDRKARRVEPQHDYLIYPGDLLVVVEDHSTMFDDIMNSTTGPMGKQVGRRMISG